MKRITLALQGGGSHGAFTWGVLDRLLREPDLEIAAISGTSSGALNAVALAYGMMIGGPKGAQDTLGALWHAISEASHHWASWLAQWAAMFSPYAYPPYANPLGKVLGDVIDFNIVRMCRSPKIFICATNVHTSRRKVFGTNEITADVVMASACLPNVFRAVEIDGEAYWDGGFMGNPVLSPLLPHSTDVVIVEVNRMVRDGIPTTTREIADRMNEITFNSALVHEIQMINTISRLLEYGELVSARFRQVYFHRIAAEPALEGSKHDTRMDYLRSLHDEGVRAAELWLRNPRLFGNVGQRSSIDVPRDMLAPLEVDDAVGSRA